MSREVWIIRRCFMTGLILMGLTLGGMADPVSGQSDVADPAAQEKEHPVAQPAAADTRPFLERFQPGQSFAEFIRQHPRAIYSRMENADRVPDPAVPGGLLEEWDADPWLGLDCIADMGFRDTGALYEFVIMWRGKSKDVADRASRFYRGCLERHGTNFSREVMVLNPDREGSGVPVPVLVWDGGDWRFVAYCVDTWKDRPDKPGVCVYACMERGDPTLADWLKPDRVSPEVRESLWRDLDKVLTPLVQDIAARSSEPAAPRKKE